MVPLYFRAMSAVGLTSMSWRFRSICPGPMRAPTMLMKENTCVFWVPMMRVLKSSKLRYPAEPASATVVTPTHRVKPSGWRPQKPLA